MSAHPYLISPVKISTKGTRWANKIRADMSHQNLNATDTILVSKPNPHVRNLLTAGHKELGLERIVVALGPLRRDCD